MTDADKKQQMLPDCYGRLDIVFPRAKEGLRTSPIACMACVFKTECLREAMQSAEGASVREEQVDRAYRSGMMGFLERWSKKKMLHQRKKQR